MDHSAHAHPPAPADRLPTAQENAQIVAHMKRYIAVGGVEILMVLVTVAIGVYAPDYVSSHTAVALTLLATSVNAVVVASILMHLKTESSTIWKFLYFTGAFFFILFFLMLLYYSSPIMGSTHTHH